jgi:hypothetical protein
MEPYIMCVFDKLREIRPYIKGLSSPARNKAKIIGIKKATS